MKINLKLLAMVASIALVNNALRAANNDPAINPNNNLDPAINPDNNLDPVQSQTCTIHLQGVGTLSLPNNIINKFNSIKYYQNPNNLPIEQQKDNNTNCIPANTPMSIIFEKYNECLHDALYFRRALSKHISADGLNEIDDKINKAHITLDNNRAQAIQILFDELQKSNPNTIVNIGILLFNIMSKLNYQVSKYCHKLVEEIDSNAQNEQVANNDKVSLDTWLKYYEPVIPYIADIVLCNGININVANSENGQEVLQTPIDLAIRLLETVNVLKNNATFKNYIQNKTINWEQEQNNSNQANNADQLIAQ